MKKIERCRCGGAAKIRKIGNAYAVRCNVCGMMSEKVYRNSGVTPAFVQNFVIDSWNNMLLIYETIERRCKNGM